MPFRLAERAIVYNIVRRGAFRPGPWNSISAAVQTAKSGYVGWIFVFIVLTAFEFLNGRGDQKLRSRVNGLAYWTVFIPLSAVLF